MMEFVIRWPHDTNRVVPVPGGSRVRLVYDVNRSEVVDIPVADDISSQTFIWHDEHGLEVGRTEMLWLPDPGQLNVRRERRGTPGDACGVLSNRKGTAVQARAAWGRIMCKYDGFLAANLDTAGPGDRRVVIPWMDIVIKLGPDETLIGAGHVVAFETSPKRLRWALEASGVRMTAVLSLGEGNAIALGFYLHSPAAEDCEIHIKPWLEDRCFHGITQAFTGPENGFPKRITPSETGFTFTIDGGQLNVHAGIPFHEMPQWRYCVPLPESQARGLEPQTDVFSPGHFVWKPSEKDSIQVQAVIDGAAPEVTDESEDDLTLVTAMEQAMDLYLADRSGELTVIAGFPWFLDWGRDSLIFMRGLIACGRLNEAGSILRRFAAFEENGTLPNLLRGELVTNRETSDAPLWLVVGIGELLEAGGGQAEEFKSVVHSILEARRSGLMDQATGLIYSAPHYTWMDTDHPPFTPREGFPIEIQALWHAALKVGARWFGKESGLADKVQQSIEKLFWIDEAGWYADCLNADLSQDMRMRPNQWLAISLGVLRDPARLQRTLEATQCLLVPGAARSLRPEDTGWWPRYTGPEDVTRKPAYHNGTAWGWQYPLYSEALAKVYGSSAVSHARCLLSASSELLREGCLGQLPEILDGALPHVQRGCRAQAWSVSEWLRVLKGLERADRP
ncbi:MAG: glycogen debranching enzyme N-terminal domain-containing protein [Verrucomicrobiaceae bacterium]|nr:glycogen debranching enzyme N-terminal domain-containing protein [Verrucomicrobiaceae bacterium]